MGCVSVGLVMESPIGTSWSEQADDTGGDTGRWVSVLLLPWKAIVQFDIARRRCRKLAALIISTIIIIEIELFTNEVIHPDQLSVRWSTVDPFRSEDRSIDPRGCLFGR